MLHHLQWSNCKRWFHNSNDIFNLNFLYILHSNFENLCQMLNIKHMDDLEFSHKIGSFKFQTFSNSWPCQCLVILLNAIHEWWLILSCPNMKTTLHLFVTLPITVATAELHKTQNYKHTICNEVWSQWHLTDYIIHGISNCKLSYYNVVAMYFTY